MGCAGASDRSPVGGNRVRRLTEPLTTALHTPAFWILRPGSVGPSRNPYIRLPLSDSAPSPEQGPFAKGVPKPLNAAQERLSQEMVGYWTGFAEDHKCSFWDSLE